MDTVSARSGVFPGPKRLFNIVDGIFSRSDPDGIAVIEGKTVTTYRQLNAASYSIADRLREAIEGHTAPRIGLECRDGAAYIALALGILRAGACFVPIAPELAPSERELLVSTIGLDFLLKANIGPDEEIAFDLEHLSRDAMPEWTDSLASLHPAFIRFSSGTTGKSKGIVLSHDTLRERVEAANAGLGIGPADKVLWVLSMSHHFAVSIILYLWHGATILLPKSHLAGDVLEAAIRHHATVIYAAPFHYELLAGDAGKTPWPSLRLAVSTTTALAVETGKAFDRAFGVYPSQALGIIEVGLPCLNVPDPRNQPASIGQVQPAFAFELRDPQGRAVGPGEQGTLFLQGPGMFDAYIEPWQERADAMSDGWFSTGDIAEADGDGFLYLVGRSQSVISVGGMKFFPEEVETVLCRHPLIAEARVFSRPHPTFGMIPAAELVAVQGEPSPTVREIVSFCRKQIARYKIPVEIAFVKAITRTASGKIRRA
ncbi:MAG: class I adenylate-forming enzyme family protein [Verrucomicrobiota bacterium]